MFEVADGSKEASDLVSAEHDWETARLTNWGDAGRDIIAAQGDAIEEAQSASGLVIVTQGSTAVLDEVEQESTDVFGSELLR
jgi:hypothetical protein